MIHWPTVRRLTGTDAGREVRYDTDEVPCTDSCRDAECRASGECEYCGRVLCDAHGADWEHHFGHCPLVALAELGTEDRLAAARDEAERERWAAQERFRVLTERWNALGKALTLAEWLCARCGREERDPVWGHVSLLRPCDRCARYVCSACADVDADLRGDPPEYRETQRICKAHATEAR